ncbi:MAG: hypothetical protein WD981_03500, partial [Gaiellaceae bacterium]
AATPSATFAATALTNAVAIADADGDGHRDVVLGTNGRNLLLVNRGGGIGADWGGLKPPVPIGSESENTTAVAVAAIDAAAGLDLVVVNNGAANRLHPGAPAKTTRIGVANINASLTAGGVTVGLTDGQGALVLTPGGVAGAFSGRVSAAGTGFGLGISIAVRINNTESALEETLVVGGVTIPVRFSETEVRTMSGPFVHFSGSGVIRLGDFVEIRGSVSFGAGEVSGEDVTVFLGQGPAFLEDGSINPTARGVYITDASFRAIEVSGMRAFSAVGDIAIVGIPGVTLSGDTVRVKFNQTATSQFTGDFQVAAGVQSFSGNVTLAVAGVQLTGGFAFAKNPDTSFTLTLTSVTLNLGDGPPHPVSVTGINGTLTVSTAGVVGSITGNPSITVPGFSLGGTVTVLVNTTPNAVTSPTAISANTIRVRAAGVTLTVLGQSVQGTFEFEQMLGELSPSAPPGTQAPKLIRIAATGVSFTLGSGSAGVSVSGGSGFFVVTPAGVAGKLQVTVTFTI